VSTRSYRVTVTLRREFEATIAVRADSQMEADRMALEALDEVASTQRETAPAGHLGAVISTGRIESQERTAMCLKHKTFRHFSQGSPARLPRNEEAAS
jgi:hypothetical protein